MGIREDIKQIKKDAPKYFKQSHIDFSHTHLMSKQSPVISKCGVYGVKVTKNKSKVTCPKCRR